MTEGRRSGARESSTNDGVEIRGKLGTHSTAVYYVQDSDEPPSQGDVVMVRSNQDLRVSKWTEVIVHEIKFGDFYYLGFR